MKELNIIYYIITKSFIYIPFLLIILSCITYFMKCAYSSKLIGEEIRGAYNIIV